MTELEPQVPEVEPDETEEEDEDSGVESESLADNVSFTRPDMDLEMLVSIANRIGLGMSVTLVTSGGVVSGSLIGYSQFWNETAEVFEGMDIEDERAAAGLKALIEHYRERAAEGAPGTNEGSKSFPPRYIHLKDAWIHDGSRHLNVGRWRGRLAMVVGWSFGQAS